MLTASTVPRVGWTEMQSEEFDNNNAQSHPGCGNVRGGEFVKKLRKHPEKSQEPTRVPVDFEPEVIDETDDGCTIIIPARPPKKEQSC